MLLQGEDVSEVEATVKVYSVCERLVLEWASQEEKRVSCHQGRPTSAFNCVLTAHTLHLVPLGRHGETRCAARG